MKTKFLILSSFLLLLFNFSYSQNPQWVVYNTTNSGLPGNFIGGIIIDTNNIKWIGTNNGLARFDGNQWLVFDTTNSPVKSNILAPRALDRYNNLWIGIAEGGGVAKFNGVNWTIYTSTNSGLLSNYVSRVAIDTNNVKWIGTTYGLAKFNDTTWTIYTSTNSGLPMNSIWCLAVEGHVKWIGHQTMNNNAGLTRYNDTSWIIYTAQNSGLPTNILTSITVDLQGNKWITTEFGGVAKFNSSNNIWTIYNTTNSGLPDNNTLSYTFKNTLKWIGTLSSGITRYNDTDWTVYNPNNSPLPDVTVGCIAYDHYSNLWIGTTLGVAVYNPNGIIGIENYKSSVPKYFTLYQNYPNPFNGSTLIKFDVSKSSHFNLILYDISGKFIKFLLSEDLKPSSYEIQLKADNLSSGVYFCKLIANEYSETKKMVLLK
jgi:ligand-binding sensor domain-containing protein